jgi:hypothetical protein
MVRASAGVRWVNGPVAPRLLSVSSRAHEASAVSHGTVRASQAAEAVRLDSARHSRRELGELFAMLINFMERHFFGEPAIELPVACGGQRSAADGVAARFGRPWSFLLIGAMVAIPLVVHGWWLPSKGVNGWTGEPKARYYELRGWRLPPNG